MSLNVGGIYVEASKVSQQAVLDVIRAYWARLGATESALDPLAFEPLGLEKTGQLGFAVSKAVDAAADMGRWIAIYDSERYTADPALAHELAKKLGVDVWFFEIAGATDNAYAKRYGKKEKTLRGEDNVSDELAPLPYSMTYFNKLREEPKAKKAFALLSFEGIPHRKSAKYSGPSDETKATTKRKASAAELVERRDAEGLIALAKTDREVASVVVNAVDRIKQTSEAEIAFVYAVADLVLSNDIDNFAAAEACARRGDLARLEKALSNLPDYMASLATNHASEVSRGGEPGVGFAMLEQITRNASAQPVAFNNALHAFFAAQPMPELPAARLDALFTRSFVVGTSYPSIFHNLACCLVRVKRLDDAVRAVALAVKWGYEDVERMKEDSDLAPLRRLPGWKKAFAAPDTVSLDDLVVHSTDGDGKQIVTIAPVVMLSLAIGKRTPALRAIADLLTRLVEELPAHAFEHFMWGSGMCSWSPIKKGKLARDIASIRKPPKYDHLLRWGSHDGEPLGHRVTVDLDSAHGEVTIMLPRAAASDPDALASLLASWAAQVPFVSGVAGFGLGVYEEGPIVGPGAYAHHQIGGMRARFLGLCVSGKEAEIEVFETNRAPVPGWLTFLSEPLVKKLGGEKSLAKAVGPASVTALGNGVCIRAASAPFIGVATAPTDLAALPAVAKALHRVRIEAEEEARWDAIEEVAVPKGLSIDPISSLSVASAPPPASKKLAETKPVKTKPVKEPAGKRASARKSPTQRGKRAGASAR